MREVVVGCLYVQDIMRSVIAAASGGEAVGGELNGSVSVGKSSCRMRTKVVERRLNCLILRDHPGQAGRS